MPITDTIPRMLYTATAGQTIFPYPWPIADAEELRVYAAGVLLTLNIDYTVTGVGGASGNVILTSGALAGTILVLLRHVPLSQEVDYIDHNPFPAAAHEGALDKLTRITQQLQEELNRAVRQKPSTILPPVTLPDPNSLTTTQGGKKALVYNDAGTDLSLLEIVSQTGIVGDIIPGIAFGALPAPGSIGRQRQVTSGAPAGLYHDIGTAWVGPTVYDPANKAGADVSAKIAAVLADVSAAGGVIDARSFRGAQAWGTQVNISKPITLLLGVATYAVTAAKALAVTGAVNLKVEGQEMMGTLFQAGTPTLRVIDFASDGHLSVSHLYATDGGIPQTAGYLVHLFPPAGGGPHVIQECTTDSLWEAITIGKANQLSIQHCTLVAAKNAEITASYFGAANFDAGTTFINDCILASNTIASTYGIQWNDSSGLYVSNCHIIGHAVGVAALSTQNHIFNEITLYDNRIGLQGLVSLVIQRVSGTGGFAQIHIANNLFGSPHVTYVNAVQLGIPGGADDVFFATLVNNRFTAQSPSPATLIGVNHANDVYIAGNVFVAANPSNAAIGIPAGVTDLRIGRNKYVGFITNTSISEPPIPGVVMEPEIRGGSVTVDPGPIPAGTQTSFDVTIAGLRPSHGDRLFFERQGAISAGLVFVGSTIATNDTARLYFYNASGVAVDDGPQVWRYTWIDITP